MISLTNQFVMNMCTQLQLVTVIREGTTYLTGQHRFSQVLGGAALAGAAAGITAGVAVVGAMNPLDVIANSVPVCTDVKKNLCSMHAFLLHVGQFLAAHHQRGASDVAQHQPGIQGSTREHPADVCSRRCSYHDGRCWSGWRSIPCDDEWRNRRQGQAGWSLGESGRFKGSRGE